MKRPVIQKITQYTFAAGVFAVTTFGVLPSTGHKNTNAITINKSTVSSKAMLYDALALDSMGLSRTAFNYAIQGMEKLESEGKLENADLVTIVDFSLSSSKKRLFVIDLKNQKVLFNTLVSHGRNSGTDIATSFSNSPESFKSSLGFYVTGGIYRGEHGMSLRLEGQEKGINDNALARGIVMHSAAYVNEKLAALQGYIGRSLGCPAVPEKLHKKIIEMIKDGTCLFLYSPDKYYMAHSQFMGSMPVDTTVA